jgi:hypothetical protein
LSASARLPVPDLPCTVSIGRRFDRAAFLRDAPPVVDPAARRTTRVVGSSSTAYEFERNVEVVDEDRFSERHVSSDHGPRQELIDSNQANDGVALESKLERLKFIRAEIRHEFSLLSSRVGAYLTCQSFLVIAFALSMGNTNPEWGGLFRLIFPPALSLLGIATSMQAHLGIRGASYTIALWHEKQNRLVEDPGMEDYHVRRPPIGYKNGAIDKVHRQSLLFAEWSPWIFAFAWLSFGVLALFLGLV